MAQNSPYIPIYDNIDDLHSIPDPYWPPSPQDWDYQDPLTQNAIPADTN